MVKVLIGNLFESKAQTLVNTVNCVGVMGKGVALEFKKRFPEMFEDYEQRCKRREVKLGRPYLFKRLVPPWILNFPTKDHWRSVASLEAIVEGLKHLIQHYKEWGITSMAVPPLGCGQGQLEWCVVGPTLYRYLSKMDIPIELYAPYGTPHQELKLEFLGGEAARAQVVPISPEREWIKPGWVALVDSAKARRAAVSLARWTNHFSKDCLRCYGGRFANRTALPKGSYGPFSQEVKGLIARLINNGLIREERLGQMFAVKVGPTFFDARKAYTAYLKNWEPIIEKTTDLFMRVDSNQAEVVATVLFAAQDLRKRKSEKPSEREVLDAVMEWKQRRRPRLNEPEVALAIRNLAALRWLPVKPSQNLPLPEESTADL